MTIAIHLVQNFGYTAITDKNFIRPIFQLLILFRVKKIQYLTNALLMYNILNIYKDILSDLKWHIIFFRQSTLGPLQKLVIYPFFNTIVSSLIHICI